MKLHLSLVAIVVAAVLALVLTFKGHRTEGFEEENRVCDGVYYETFPGFLSDEECDALIRAALKRGLVKSQVGSDTEDDPAKLDETARKSEQTWFAPGEHAVTDKIARKTRRLLESKKHCIGKYDFEDIQVARYGPGGYYYHHYDADDCDDACPRNQRLATLMVYLKSPKRGGHTDFPLLDAKVQAVKGTAVFFWVSDPTSRKVYEKSLHAGMPVGEGEKVISNIWTRAA